MAGVRAALVATDMAKKRLAYPSGRPGQGVSAKENFRVRELLELRELQDRTEALRHLVGGAAEHHAVEDDVLTRRQLGVEPHPELQEWPHLAGDLDRPVAVARMTGERWWTD